MVALTTPLILGCFVATALAATVDEPCGGVDRGTMKDGCCQCFLGYEGEKCEKCAKGFKLSGNLCVRGVDGSSCSDLGDFASGAGCLAIGGSRVNGKCTVLDSGRKVFPCVCKDGDCSEAVMKTRTSSSCLPVGPHMYTPFPNDPVHGKPFSLVVTGCGLGLQGTPPKYMVVPAYDSNGEETSCETEGEKEANAEFDSTTCRADVDNRSFNSSDCDRLVFDEFTSKEKNGFKTGSSSPEEASFSDLVLSYPEEVVQEDKATYFKLCYTTEHQEDGKTTQLWRELENHNSAVDRRDNKFKLNPEFEERADMNGAAGMGGDGSCCEGLKVGSLCLPLWAFLLLWLLMALCLGALGFMLHKNKNDIEAQKNNEKYEKFHTDNEMQDYAKEQDEDDDI